MPEKQQHVEQQEGQKQLKIAWRYNEYVEQQEREIKSRQALQLQALQQDRMRSSPTAPPSSLQA